MGYQLRQTSSGLVELDKFDRTAGPDIGNGWAEDPAADWSLYSDNGRSVAEHADDQGGHELERINKNVGTHPQDMIAEFVLDVMILGAWESTQMGIGYDADPSGSPTQRLIAVFYPYGDLVRLYRNGVQLGGDQTFNFVQQKKYGCRVVAEKDGDNYDYRIYIVERTGWDDTATDYGSATLSVDDDTSPPTFGTWCTIAAIDRRRFANFLLCGQKIVVTGIPTGWKIQIDSRSAVTESGGEVSINVQTWNLPATTIKLLDDGDVEQDSLTPSGGIFGGDVYVIAVSQEVGTPWENSEPVARSEETPWESGSGISSTYEVFWGASQSIAVESIPSVEILQSIQSEAETSVEWLLGVQQTRDSPFESEQGIISSLAVSWESSQVIVQSQTIEYEILQGLYSTLETFWESRGPITSSVVVPIAWSLSIRQPRTIEIEFNQGISSPPSVVPLEFLLGIYSPLPIFWESLGLPVSKTLSVEWESVQGLYPSVAVPYAYGGAARSSRSVFWDSRGLLVVAVGHQCEWLLSVESDTEFAWESLTGLEPDFTVPIEILGSVVETEETPISWEGLLRKLVTPFWESRGPIAPTVSVPWESLVSVFQEEVVDWASIGHVANERMINWNAEGKVFSPRDLPWESQQALYQPTEMPWESLIVVPGFVECPWEASRTLRRASSPLYERLQGISRSRTAPWASEGTIAVSEAVFVELLQGLQSEILVPWEAEGRLGVVVIPFWESRGPVIVSVETLYEWLLGGSGQVSSIKTLYEILLGVKNSETISYEVIPGLGTILGPTVTIQRREILRPTRAALPFPEPSLFDPVTGALHDPERAIIGPPQPVSASVTIPWESTLEGRLRLLAGMLSFDGHLYPKNPMDLLLAGQVSFAGALTAKVKRSTSGVLSSSSELRATSVVHGHWHLNHEGGDLTVVDSSGHGRHGTLIGLNASAWDTVTKKLGAASLKFPGYPTNGYVTFGSGDVANFERTVPFSAECWTRLDTHGCLMSRFQTPVPHRGWRIRVHSTGELVFTLSHIYGSDEIVVRTPVFGISFWQNRWRHIVVTYDGSVDASGVRIWIDGNEQTLTVIRNALTGTTLSPEEFLLNGVQGGYYGFFKGWLDECVLYNIELTPAQVLYRWNGGAGREAPPLV